MTDFETWCAAPGDDDVERLLRHEEERAKRENLEHREVEILMGNRAADDLDFIMMVKRARERARRRAIRERRRWR